MPRSDAYRERARIARRARYQARKESGICLRCRAGLTDDDETLYCAECRAAVRRRASVANKTPERQEQRRRRYRDRYANDAAFRERERVRVELAKARSAARRAT